MASNATITYSIPTGTYEYVKLVYKQDRIPTSINDGTAIDLNTSATSVEVTGLSDTIGTVYFFKIFTDKTESDEYRYTVTTLPPRFSVVKTFVSDNGTFHWNIPSWMEEHILEVLNSTPSETSITFPIAQYPQIEDFYDAEITSYPLQYHTNLGVYPEGGGTFPSKQSYINGDYKLDFGFPNDGSGNVQYDSFKKDGEWVQQSGISSSYAKASSNYKSMIAQLFILDHRQKRGFPALIVWCYGPRYTDPKTRLVVTKLGDNPNPNYVALAEAVYNALK